MVMNGLAIGTVKQIRQKGPANREQNRCELAVLVVGGEVRCDGGIPTRIYFNFTIFFSFCFERPPVFPQTCRSRVVTLLRITKERVVSM